MYVMVCEMIRESFCVLHKAFSGLNITICGSYRKQAKTSGDIDVLISDPQNRPKILQDCIQVLEKINYIVDTYAKILKPRAGKCCDWSHSSI